MVKLFFLLCLACSISYFPAQSQVVLQINAGSRAPFGDYQSLLVNLNGECSYKLVTVNGPVKDSSRFTIAKSQLDSIFSKAEQIGFFQLNNKYDGGRVDGAGILIAMNSSGKKKSVQVLNVDVPQVNELVAFINRILQPQKIRIDYGQSAPQK